MLAWMDHNLLSSFLIGCLMIVCTVLIEFLAFVGSCFDFSTQGYSRKFPYSGILSIVVFVIGVGFIATTFVSFLQKHVDIAVH